MLWKLSYCAKDVRYTRHTHLRAPIMFVTKAKGVVFIVVTCYCKIHTREFCELNTISVNQSKIYL
jgi:hypothetical protein